MVLDCEHLLPFFLLSCLFLMGSNASSSPEKYWKSMLPNTPLPKALQELLPLDVGSNAPSNFEDCGACADETNLAYYPRGYWSETNKMDKNVDFNRTTIFFLYNDLQTLKKMTLAFSKTTNAIFLPRNVTESIPFSSNKFANILNYFSIKPTSKKAQIMKKTIKECEDEGIEGEDKYCATSLESLVDFILMKLGKNVETLVNEAEEENKKQEYTILKGIKKMDENHIVCHKQQYPYAVYYCHTITQTKVYVVPMVGTDGSKAKAIVVCHFNTSTWNPRHYAFLVLKVKPGESPICHFLQSDTIVWIPT